MSVHLYDVNNVRTNKLGAFEEVEAFISKRVVSIFTILRKMQMQLEF
jgi:hypothetical protein